MGFRVWGLRFRVGNLEMSSVFLVVEPSKIIFLI